VHDLLGVDVRPADSFPQDDSGCGFDNIGEVLSRSPVLMDVPGGGRKGRAAGAIWTRANEADDGEPSSVASKGRSKRSFQQQQVYTSAVIDVGMKYGPRCAHLCNLRNLWMSRI
jgi:hypothetical protein